MTVLKIQGIPVQRHPRHFVKFGRQGMHYQSFFRFVIDRQERNHMPFIDKMLGRLAFSGRRQLDLRGGSFGQQLNVIVSIFAFQFFVGKGFVQDFRGGIKRDIGTGIGDQLLRQIGAEVGIERLVLPLVWPTWHSTFGPCIPSRRQSFQTATLSRERHFPAVSPTQRNSCLAVLWRWLRRVVDCPCARLANPCQ
jgi:hypothetical protein